LCVAFISYRTNSFAIEVDKILTSISMYLDTNTPVGCNHLLLRCFNCTNGLGSVMNKERKRFWCIRSV